MDPKETKSPTQLRVLHLEDNRMDRAVIRETLREGGLECDFHYVETQPEFETALGQGVYDIILSDFTLPSYDGMKALAAAQRLQPEAPFLFVSGTIGEELAVESLKRGAIDYVLKRHLERLAPAVRRALREAQERTKRLRAEEALRESEERFSKAFHISPIGMCITEFASGQFLDANQAFLDTFGFTREEVVGRTSLELGMYAQPEQRAQFLDLLRTKSLIRNHESHFRRKSGETGIALHSVVPVELAGRKCLLTLFQDMTERQKLEAQLRHSQKMESVGQLAGGIAHDFNNLLTVIDGHASFLLTEKSLPDSSVDSAREISLAAERAANLTRQLLTFSRKQVIQPNNLDLNKVIENTIKMLRRVLGEDISLELHLASDLPSIHADPGMMEQILLNLAVNSRDAMPKGGQLIVNTGSVMIGDEEVEANPEARVGSFVCWSIRDTGCGISPELLPRIFEPFFTTKEAGKGTGLGLATVFGIVKQHQGWINVASAEGHGTAFQIFLPSAGEAAAILEAKPAEPKVRGGTETILLVEDEAGVRTLAQMILERHGYIVLEANSGVAALEVWRAHKEKIDLLLTDLVMPGGITGVDLAVRLLAERPTLKVIFTSGYSTDVAVRRISWPDEVKFLQKPYRPEQLDQVVRDALDG